jgi:hypothetical protein
MADNRPIFNVHSVNQQGGITAGQVNIGHPPRTLDPISSAQLKQAVPRNKKVVVVAVMGDGDAFQFANQILGFLKSEGLDAEGVDQVVYGNPVMGQHVVDRGDRTEVIIGNRQQ